MVPIPKPGNNSDFCNYRPISICSAVGKVLERMVANRLSDHLFTFKLLSDAQHGFLPGRLCTTKSLDYFMTGQLPWTSVSHLGLMLYFWTGLVLLTRCPTIGSSANYIRRVIQCCID